MKDEYDFSNAERGKFYQPGAQLNIPVYLDQDVESQFAEKARIKGVELQSLINELLRKDISLIQEVTGKNQIASLKCGFRFRVFKQSLALKVAGKAENLYLNVIM